MTVDPKAQNRWLEFKMRELETYKKENFVMKRTIQASLGFIKYNIPAEINLATVEEEKESWPDKAQHFAVLRSKLLETVIYLCKIHGRAVSTREVMNCFETRHRKVFLTMTNPGETIPRRGRELAKEGYLTRPAEGYWFPGSKALAEPPPTTT